MSRKVSFGCPFTFSVPLKRVGPTCEGAGVLCHMPPESMLVCMSEWGRETHNTKPHPTVVSITILPVVIQPLFLKLEVNEVDLLLYKCRLKLKRIDLPLPLLLPIHLHPTQDTFGKKATQINGRLDR